MSVRLVTGAGVFDVARFRLRHQGHLKRCHECGVTVLRKDGTFYDPSEGGESLIEHPHQLAEEKILFDVSKNPGLGYRARKGFKDEKGVRHKVCPAYGCRNVIKHGTYRDTFLFCRFHWSQLPPKTRQGFRDVRPESFWSVLKSCLKYLQIRDAARERAAPKAMNHGKPLPTNPDETGKESPAEAGSTRYSDARGRDENGEDRMTGPSPTLAAAWPASYKGPTEVPAVRTSSKAPGATPNQAPGTIP